jgi:putative ABC transport system permease protein
VKLHDITELASRNLRQSVLRNSLTTIGVAVGVASLVAMVSLGIGLQQLAGKRLTRSGLFDSVIVSSRRDFLPRADRRAGITATNAKVLDEAVRQEIAKLPNVVEVNPDIRFNTEVRYNDEPHVGSVGGLPPSARNNEAFDTLKGKYFSGPDTPEAILVKDFATDLDKNPQSLIGKQIVVRYAERQAMSGAEANGNQNGTAGAGDDDFGYSIIRREQPLTIVGIIDQEPFGGFRGDSKIFVPLELAQKLNVAQGSDIRSVLRDRPGAHTYVTLTVRVAKPAEVEATEAAIKKLGFSTFSLLDASRNLRQFFRILDTFLGIFGSLALVVASLGIVNTLVMAILERRREIGIMKAIGASDRDVRGLFFAEAGVMGMVGGILGVLSGWLIGRMINFGTNIYLRREQIPPQDVWIVPWWLVAAAVVFAFVMTLVAALYPASRAAKLDPVQALRYE